MTNPATVLLEIQAADVEIMRARKRLEDLPEKRQILAVRAKIKETAGLKAKAEMLVHKLESELKARQDEHAMIAEKLGAEQAKVMETTDHRQITALTREMDGLRRRNDKLDMESLQYMERIEKASSQVSTVQAHLEKLQERDAELVSAYQAAGTAIQTEAKAATARRTALAAALPADVLQRYESVRDAKGGVGVGRLEGDSCSACRMDLPAERLRELRDGPDIGLCPQCRRLIVVRSEESA